MLDHLCTVEGARDSPARCCQQGTGPATSDPTREAKWPTSRLDTMLLVWETETGGKACSGPMGPMGPPPKRNRRFAQHLTTPRPPVHLASLGGGDFRATPLHHLSSPLPPPLSLPTTPPPPSSHPIPSMASLGGGPGDLTTKLGRLWLPGACGCLAPLAAFESKQQRILIAARNKRCLPCTSCPAVHPQWSGSEDVLEEEVGACGGLASTGAACTACRPFPFSCKNALRL